MAGVNKVILIGHLGKDPEVKTLESGVKVAAFSLATSESFKDKDGNRKDATEWHNIVLWQKLAELAEKYLTKGSQIYVEGKIQTRTWEKEGKTNYRTEIVGQNMTFLSKSGSVSNTETPTDPNVDDLPF